MQKDLNPIPNTREKQRGKRERERERKKKKKKLWLSCCLSVHPQNKESGWALVALLILATWLAEVEDSQANSSQDPISKTTTAKMNWRCGLSNRAPTLQA
jgi:hypothetical protein